MLCNQDPTALAAYLDGELSSGQQIAMQEHLRGCTHCAAEVAQLVSVHRGLASAHTRYTPSADFRRKIQQQTAAPKQHSGFFRLMPLAISLTALLLLAAGWMQHSLRSSLRTDAFGEVADLHINALSSTNPFDVVSTDRHTVKPWFQGKIPFSFNVPEFAGTEFTLLGGRLVYFQQQPGAQLIVGMRQHKISVLIFQDSSALNRIFAVSSAAGSRTTFNIKTWQSQSLRFIVIGDTEPSEIDKLAHSLEQVNE